MTEHSPAGRSVQVMIRVTESAAEWIDGQRGEVSRAEFVRQVLMDYADGNRKLPPPVIEEVAATDLGPMIMDALRASGYVVAKKG